MGGGEGKKHGRVGEGKKNVSLTHRPQRAPQAEERETEKKKLFPNLLCSEENKRTKSSLVPSSHTKGARTHGVALHLCTHSGVRRRTHTHRNPTAAPQTREEGVTTTSPPSSSSSTRRSVRAGKIPASKKENRRNNNNKTRAPLGCFGETPFLCPAHSNDRGERRKKKKKKREQCTATASVVVPQPHLCCCPAYFFPPHRARRRSRHAAHNTRTVREHARTRGVRFCPPLQGWGRAGRRARVEEGHHRTVGAASKSVGPRWARRAVAAASSSAGRR